MRRRRLVPLLVLPLALGLVGDAAIAAEFTPTARFSLSSTRVRANPELTIAVAQDQGEEELKSVVLRVARGFRLAKDGRLQNGEQLGEGEISIHSGPRCAGAPVGSAPITVPVDIVERDRTEQEREQGVKAVYVVDLEPVTTIDLLVRGSARNGWTLSGKIPANDLTCPPFSFEATLFRTAEESRTKIIVNPAQAGRYPLAVTFYGVDGSRKAITQRFRIRG